MSTIIEEKFQRFEFDAAWNIFKYDDGTSYANLSAAVSGTKACDFVGILSGAIAYLIEVKDFRGFRIQNRQRLADGELAMEVATKVRDTLAGIVSGCRHEDDRLPWRQLGRALTDAGRELCVVLCLEDDEGRNPIRWREKIKNQEELIRQKLAWLRPKVRVVSQTLNRNKLPGVAVTNLPGAAGHAS